MELVERGMGDFFLKAFLKTYKNINLIGIISFNIIKTTYKKIKEQG